MFYGLRWFLLCRRGFVSTIRALPRAAYHLTNSSRFEQVHGCEYNFFKKKLAISEVIPISRRACRLWTGPPCVQFRTFDIAHCGMGC